MWIYTGLLCIMWNVIILSATKPGSYQGTHGAEKLTPIHESIQALRSGREVRNAGTVAPFNYKPVLKNPTRSLVGYAGEILQYKIPADTFFDVEDGSTENLKLILLTEDSLTVPRDSWVQLNPTTQELYGLPLSDDIGSKAYSIAAMDRGAKIVRDDFEIAIMSNPKNITYEIIFTINIPMDFGKFVMRAQNRYNVAKNIAVAYGDTDVSNIRVLRIEDDEAKTSHHHMINFIWANSSHNYDHCPEAEFVELKRNMMDDTGLISDTMNQAMTPYKVTRIEITCVNQSGGWVLCSNPLVQITFLTGALGIIMWKV